MTHINAFVFSFPAALGVHPRGSCLEQQLQSLDLGLPEDDVRWRRLLVSVQEKERNGYVYECAGASLALLAQRVLNPLPSPFQLVGCSVCRGSSSQQGSVQVLVPEAHAGKSARAVSEAHDLELELVLSAKAALVEAHESLETVHLVGWRTQWLGSYAPTYRTLLQFRERVSGVLWATIGVGPAPEAAAQDALFDGFSFGLALKEQGQRAAVHSAYRSRLSERVQHLAA